MNPITSSHKFISLKATSSASNVFMKECWKWFFHVPFTLLPARALSLFVLEEYYHLPVFMPWSSLKEFPAYSNMVTCHEKSSKEEGKCWPIKKVNKKNESRNESSMSDTEHKAALRTSHTKTPNCCKNLRYTIVKWTWHKKYVLGNRLDTSSHKLKHTQMILLQTANLLSNSRPCEMMSAKSKNDPLPPYHMPMCACEQNNATCVSISVCVFVCEWECKKELASKITCIVQGGHPENIFERDGILEHSWDRRLYRGKEGL